ncbi:MAG: PIG-L family deacetylase [Acidimicrobiia bacterium]|nr:PIG-L family deacetylase [Acidimicrobiia bacterium]
MATAVFFHAHPDDEAIATGGTMALAHEAGHRVVLVFGTRGECGEPVEGVLQPGEDLGDRRALESQQAGVILGAHRVAFLGYRDSGMMGEPTNDDPRCFWQADFDEAAERLADLLHDEDADLLTIYDDHGGYGHPDHIQVHRVGLEAARRAGVGRVFESTMNRDQIREAMSAAIEAGEADDETIERAESLDDEDEPFGTPADELTHAIDVRSMIDRKRRAMQAHASQIGPDSFFFAMDEPVFEQAFGTEWYIEHGTHRTGPPFGVALFDEG